MYSHNIVSLNMLRCKQILLGLIDCLLIIIVFITFIINYIWSSPGLKSFTALDTEFLQIFFQMSKYNKQEYIKMHYTLLNILLS